MQLSVFVSGEKGTVPPFWAAGVRIWSVMKPVI
jgi:hypothetical protein